MSDSLFDLPSSVPDALAAARARYFRLCDAVESAEAQGGQVSENMRVELRTAEYELHREERRHREKAGAILDRASRRQ